MKKVLSLGLSITLALSLMACGSSEKKSDSNDSVSVEKKIIYVDITMPADMLEDSTHEELEEAANEAGYKIQFNEDGSATYTMTKSQHRQALKDYAKEIDDALAEMTEDSTIKSIKPNSKYTSFDVSVDREEFENSFDVLGLFVLAYYSAYYQMFSGISEDEVDMKINLIDNATSESYDSYTYDELMEGMEG